MLSGNIIVEMQNIRKKIWIVNPFGPSSV